MLQVARWALKQQTMKETLKNWCKRLFVRREQIHSYLLVVQWYDTKNYTSHVYYNASAEAAIYEFAADRKGRNEKYGITNIIQLW